MQSRRHSLIESVANIAVGLGVAFLTQIIVFPWFGIHVDTEVHVSITLIFTVVSLVRSYILRRLFNRFVR